MTSPAVRRRLGSRYCIRRQYTQYPPAIAVAATMLARRCAALTPALRIHIHSTRQLRGRRASPKLHLGQVARSHGAMGARMRRRPTGFHPTREVRVFGR